MASPLRVCGGRGHRRLGGAPPSDVFPSGDPFSAADGDQLLPGSPAGIHSPSAGAGCQSGRRGLPRVFFLCGTLLDGPLLGEGTFGGCPILGSLILGRPLLGRTLLGGTPLLGRTLLGSPLLGRPLFSCSQLSSPRLGRGALLGGPLFGCGELLGGSAFLGGAVFRCPLLGRPRQTLLGESAPLPMPCDGRRRKAASATIHVLAHGVRPRHR